MFNQVIEYLVQYKQSESQIYTYTDDTEKKNTTSKTQGNTIDGFFL